MEEFPLKYTNLYPKYSKFLILLYVLCFFLVNWLDLKFVRALDIVTTTATFCIAGSFFLLILITEVYGYKMARVAIWCNVLLSILLIILGNRMTTISGAQLILYDNIQISSTKLILASTIGVFCSQHLNALLLAKMKTNINGEHLVSRIILPAILASGLDSILVYSIAFYNLMNINRLISTIISIWFCKVLIIFITTPILLKLSKKLKALEKIDIYDIKTEFNPFKTELYYTPADNLFNKTQDIEAKF